MNAHSSIEFLWTAAAAAAAAMGLMGLREFITVSSLFVGGEAYGRVH